VLLFFDIDATLLVTDGAGMRCLIEAGRELFGPGFHADGVGYAGRLDPLIIDDMLTVSGVSATAEARASLRRAYAERMFRAFERPGAARALPGARELLDTLEARDGVTLALLTGNFEETGAVKLRGVGIDPERFRVRVWGDESPSRPPTRDDLPRVGLGRFREAFGRDADAGSTWIIGDTPHDARAAVVNGLRCLGVATGRYTRAELIDAGAESALQTLEDTPEVLGCLTRPAPRRG
jgi:phosphoglycolate phosphatase-like HAD superfamily hydrolase